MSYHCNMARLTKEKWLAEGEKILSEFAQDKLRILYLCDRLGVTRGSFYHHFQSIEDYVRELMKQWSRENTAAFIQAANQGGSPREQMEILNAHVMEADQSVEAAIRSWSYYHPIVKEYLAIVDQRRIDYLEQIFVHFEADSSRARIMAELEYAMLVGIQQLFPKASKEELLKRYEVYGQLHWSNR